MAKRFLYLPITEKPYVKAIQGEFKWEPGMSLAQRKRSSANLHKAIQDSGLAEHVLECSRAGESELGEALSAFNLPYYTDDATTVETAYQASKVFEKDGEIYSMHYLAKGDSMTAKRDPKLTDRSYRLVGIAPPNKELVIEHTKTPAYYNYIYIKSLIAYLSEGQVEELNGYDGFTDVMLKWYDGKVTACQAHATAMYVGMLRAGVLEDVMESIDTYHEMFRK